MDLESGNVQINTFVAIETANLIKKACNNTDLLYGADILIAEQIIQRLLSYEKSQMGLNLTHSQDKDYMQVRSHAAIAEPLVVVLEMFSNVCYVVCGRT